MRERLKKIGAHIGRSWEDETTPPPHPFLKILPPVIWELLSYLVAVRILYEIVTYLRTLF